LVGDNNLEEAGVQDIYEMFDVGGSQDFRFALQVDRASGRDHSAAEIPGVGNWTGTRRLVIEGSGIQQVADLGELNMASPSTLADFVHWGLSTYPADRTMLILWDHGAGWMGFGSDESSPGHPMLSLAQISQGVSQGLQRAGVSRFDVLGFDACLMATFEVAAVLQPYADFLIASEELEPGHGWDYRAFSAARANPSIPTIELLEIIVDEYFAQATVHDTSRDITLSVIDLAKVTALNEQLEAFATTLTQNISNNAAVIGRQREAAVRFGKNPNPTKEFHLVDLGDLARGLASVNNQSFGAARQALAAAISSAVVINRGGPLASRATGISVYFPPSRDLYNSDYDNIEEASGWRSFLRQYYSGGTSIDAIQLDPAAASVAWVGEMATINIALPTGSLSVLTAVDANFGIVDTSDNSIQLLITEPASWNGSSARGEWDGTAVVLSQGAKESFASVEVSVDDSGQFLILDVPLAYQRVGVEELGVVLMRNVLSASTYQVYNSTLYAYSDNGTAQLYPRTGDMLIPIVPTYLNLGNGPFEWRLLSDIAFAATTPIELLFDNIFPQLGAGALVYLDITVTDYGGNSDWLYGILELQGSTSGCGSVTQVGQCIGNVLRFCEEEQVYEFNCAEDGQTCGFNSAEGYYDCLGGATGSYTCDEVYDCFGNCTADACFDDCYSAGSATAQAQIDALFTCMDDYCGTILDDAQWLQCVQTNCGSELNACFGG